MKSSAVTASVSLILTASLGYGPCVNGVEHSGDAIPAFQSIEQRIYTFMANKTIPGAGVAITWKGVLV